MTVPPSGFGTLPDQGGATDGTAAGTEEVRRGVATGVEPRRSGVGISERARRNDEAEGVYDRASTHRAGADEMRGFQSCSTPAVGTSTPGAFKRRWLPRGDPGVSRVADVPVATDGGGRAMTWRAELSTREWPVADLPNRNLQPRSSPARTALTMRAAAAQRIPAAAAARASATRSLRAIAARAPIPHPAATAPMTGEFIRRGRSSGDDNERPGAVTRRPTHSYAIMGVEIVACSPSVIFWS